MTRGVTKASYWPLFAPIPALEQRLAERLVASVLLDKAWPHSHTAIERGKVGRQRNGVLVKIAALQERIASVPSETLANVAV